MKPARVQVSLFCRMVLNPMYWSLA